jgi:hypothetical protein
VAADCFSACGRPAPRCVGDRALDGICRLTEYSKENKALSIAGTKQRLPFLCFLLFEEVPTFPRNLALLSVLYIGERPEMIFSQREVTEAKTEKKIRKKTNHENKIS